MICTKCKLQISEHDKVCPFCGEPNLQYKQIKTVKVETKQKKHYFFSALFQMYRRFADFSGTTSRGEYWSCQIILLLFLVPAFRILASAGIAEMSLSSIENIILVITGLFIIISVIPMIALNIRRLHDANLTGLLILLNFIPGFGTFVYIVLTILPHKENQYMNKERP